MRPAVVRPTPLSGREAAQVGPRQLKEPGSPDWCWQTVHYLKDCMRHVSEEWRQAEQVLEDLKKTRAWEKIPPGQPYGSLDKMLLLEVGLSVEDIRTLIRSAELAARGANRDTETGRWNRGSNITTASSSRGTTESYTYRRLCRDRPDLAELVDLGEMSANEAAREAGWRRKANTVRMDDPEAAARTLRKHMPPAVLAELIQLLTKED